MMKHPGFSLHSIFNQLLYKNLRKSLLFKLNYNYLQNRINPDITLGNQNRQSEIQFSRNNQRRATQTILNLKMYNRKHKLSIRSH
jgi:hypothetical protein